jgi:cell division protease FtsH
VNEAALQAARSNKAQVEMEDFEAAKDKVIMGSERKSMVISDKDKKLTAYHEAGHAIVGRSLEGLDPIHKVTIIPRGMALGLTQTLPLEDTLNLSKSKATNMIAFLFGGRAAEELIFTDYTTGAGNDIERATDLARRMVCEWGMSEKLGPLAYEKREGPVFLGMQNQGSRDYSESKAQEIDGEVFSIVSGGHQKALHILKENEKILHAMADALLEYETIDAEDVSLLMEGKDMTELRKHRDQKQETLEKERQKAADELKKQAASKDAKKETKDSGVKDPVGNTGPVTA